ncbi:MAG TPA: adenylate/guanylate cyclase domain-containing protein [Nitrospinae bacterium]|nr:adenylate/guanylate cyclase domain-containing protein [Nitrospinota bacterium]
MEKTRGGRLKFFIGSSITILITGLMLLSLSPIDALEDRLLDYRFKIRGTVKPPEDIIIAAIDEKSIDRLGRWPWDRNIMADVVKKLKSLGVRIIVFDIIFSEAEKNDTLFSKAMADAGNVILPVFFEFDSESDIPDEEFISDSSFVNIKNSDKFNQYNPIGAKKITIPVPELGRSAIALGYVNTFPDDDGILRWEPLVIEYNGFIYPSITLQSAVKYLKIPNKMVILEATEGIRLGETYIPTDRFGRTLINYYGTDQTFSYFSISDILDGNIKSEDFHDKIVLIGATAVGIYDLRVTPFTAAMPGVEKHANVIASIIEKKFIKSVPRLVNITILLLSGLLLSLLIVRFKAFGGSAITISFLFFISLLGYYLFAQKGIWINITYPILNIFFVFISVTVYNYVAEERYAKRIRAMFSSYVTEKIVNELIKNPDMAKLGGERREITVLFSDVMGFTSFSEKHAPEDVVAILNEYLGEMTDIVLKWEGTLDKFIGDAILTFWNAPMRQENHAELAIKCALNMVGRLKELQKKWQAEGKPMLDCGIGINTGEVIVGNIGAEGKKMDYTVIGDHVNLGSRVESLTRKYNTHILITEFTLSKIKDLLADETIWKTEVTGLEKVIVKGKERPVGIYRVESLGHGVKSRVVEYQEGKVVKMEEK